MVWVRGLIPDPELPRLDDSDRVPPPPFNQIVTMGCMLLEDYAPKRLGVVGEHKSEGEMLADFAQWLTTHPTPSAPFLRHGLFSARVQAATALEFTGLQPGQPGERFVQVGEYTRTVGALR